MNRKNIVLVSALLCMVIAACHKKEETATGQPKPGPAADQTIARLQRAYGFAAQVPKDAEAYTAFYDIRKLWRDLRDSKAAAALRANPSIRKHLDDPSLRQALGQVQQHPTSVKLRAVIGDALAEEAFIILPQGTAAKLQAWQHFVNEMRVQQFKSALAATGARPDADPIAGYLAAYQSEGKALEIPAVIVGAKFSTEKAVLTDLIAGLEKKLPAGAESSTFNLNGNLPFKSLVFTASKMVPQAQQDVLKKMLAAKISDPKALDDVFQSLMARKMEVAYGFIGDYFVVSLGEDHAHLKFAATPGESLLARPEIKVAAQYAEKPLLSFSWNDAAMGMLSLPHYELTPWFEALKTDLDQKLPGIDLKKLGDDLARIDAKGAKIFPKDVTSIVGVTYRDRGICSEIFGGMKMPALNGAKPLKFESMPANTTFFWMDAQRNPAIKAAAFAWMEDVASTGYNLFLNVGMQKLPDKQRLGFGIFQNLAVPKLIELYQITRDQYSNSLGDEGALAVDLGGEMPAIPMLPQPIIDNGKMIRVAVVKEVKDRKLLAQSWESYLKVARDVALMIPQTAQMPGGLPEPKTETTDGVAQSYYPLSLPFPTGDLLPNVATTDNVLVMSTSRKYSLELAKAASNAPSQKPIALEMQINSKAACDFLEKWVAIVKNNPDMMTTLAPDKAEEVKRRLPVISALLQAARYVTGIECQVYEENGQQRVTTRIGWEK